MYVCGTEEDCGCVYIHVKRLWKRLRQSGEKKDSVTKPSAVAALNRSPSDLWRKKRTQCSRWHSTQWNETHTINRKSLGRERWVKVDRRWGKITFGEIEEKNRFRHGFLPSTVGGIQMTERVKKDGWGRRRRRKKSTSGKRGRKKEVIVHVFFRHSLLFLYILNIH